VDPAIHNSNTFEFGGRRIQLGLNGSRVSDQALEAVRRFVFERGTSPTAASWTHARMSPSERTIRRRFGSFRAAVRCAGIDIFGPARPA
jgi:Homing endonuclease associated repeat